MPRKASCSYITPQPCPVVHTSGEDFVTHLVLSHTDDAIYKLMISTCVQMENKYIHVQYCQSGIHNIYRETNITQQSERFVNILRDLT